MLTDEDEEGWIGPVRLRPATMAKLPAPDGASEDPLVVMTFEVTIVEPLLLSALDEIENTGPLRLLVVVMAVDASVEMPWLSPTVPEEVTTGCNVWDDEEAGEGVTRS